MHIKYKSKKLEQSLTTDKGLTKNYGALAKKIKLRMTQLREAESLAVILKLKSLRLHPYKGADKGTWSIDIHKNWRILFSIENDPIPTREDGSVILEAVTIIGILEVTDPH